MTPKQEAKELFDLYISLIPLMEIYPECGTKIHKAHKGARKSQAKEGVLICVDNEFKARLKEIDELSNFLPPRVQTQAIIDVGISCKEVKQEIKKL